MAKKRLASYLRTERKRAGLTQKEIAFLVGAKNRAQISRFERLRRLPTSGVHDRIQEESG
jgi:transcriptional regulator with XRE-family HTH domain